MNDITRRGALGAALGALAGCGPQPVTNRAQSQQALFHEMIQQLQASGIRFLDQNGQEVSLRALQEQLRGSPSTLSFIISGCNSGTCNLIGESLALASEQRPSLNHVVIAGQGAADFYDHALAQTMEARGNFDGRRHLRTSGVDANTIVLFPTMDGQPTQRSLDLGMLEAMRLQHEFDLITIGNSPQGHSSMIKLYDAQGRLLTQTSGNFPSEVRNLIPEFIPEQGIGR